MSDDSVNQPTSGTEAEKVRPPKPRIRFEIGRAHV